jgi:hypothetical protein
MKKLLLIIVVFVVSCGDHRSSNPFVPPADTSSVDFIGTWHYFDTVDYGKSRLPDSVTVVISDITYRAYGLVRTDRGRVTWFYRSGTWQASPDTIVFFPDTCLLFDINFFMLQKEDCPVSYRAMARSTGSGTAVVMDSIVWRKE